MREHDGGEWAAKARLKGKGNNEQDEEDDNSEGNDQGDIKREDAELEKILRDYNNEARGDKKRTDDLLDKPLDLPFYKGI